MAPNRGRGRWGLGNGLAGALQRGRGRPSNVAGGRAVGGALEHLKEGSQWPRNVAGRGGGGLEPLKNI